MVLPQKWISVVLGVLVPSRLLTLPHPPTHFITSQTYSPVLQASVVDTTVMIRVAQA